jgi:hypothetical protein
MDLPVSMRVAPTGLTVSGVFTLASAGFNPTVTLETNLTSKDALGIGCTSTGNLAQFRAYQLIALGDPSFYIEVTGTEL